MLWEGAFVDRNGKRLKPGAPVVWARTGLTGDNGKPVEAPLCKLSPHCDANNEHSTRETIEPQGQGLITTPCRRGQIGPLRNCGFATTRLGANCVPGARTKVTYAIPTGTAPQVVRITEFSHVLNSPIPARYEDSYVPLRPGISDQPSMLANVVVNPSSETHVTFRCPSARNGGAHEPGGTYGVYTAPVFPDDRAAPVRRA
jgi:hypothetical protein